MAVRNIRILSFKRYFNRIEKISGLCNRSHSTNKSKSFVMEKIKSNIMCTIANRGASILSMNMHFNGLMPKNLYFYDYNTRTLISNMYPIEFTNISQIAEDSKENKLKPFKKFH